MRITNINDTIQLHNGTRMPLFGLGVFRADNGSEVENAVTWALEAGYRHIDTAAAYGNEEGVGKAVKASGIPRNELFITTKVWTTEIRSGNVDTAFDQSLERLGMDYVDLLLLHWPVEKGVKEAWNRLEHFLDQGRVKAIGVSNFFVKHMEDLLPHAQVVPMVDQVEFHPRLQSPELMTYLRNKNIVPTAWRPIMKGQVNDIAELKNIADRHGKTPVQVTLRSQIQQGIVTIPKSVHKERIESNADIFDFELSREELADIAALDTNSRLGAHPDNNDV